MSRWTIPCSCAWASPSAAWNAIFDHFERRDRLLLDQLAETMAGDILHHDVKNFVDLIGVEGADDVGMIEPADQLHLALEPGDHSLVRGDLRRDDLERDGPVHHRVMGLVDPAHRAGADPIENDVTAHDQPVRPVRQEPPGLERRDDLVAHQGLGQLDRVERIIALQDLRLDLGELAFGQHARDAHHRQQVARNALR